MTLCVIYYGHLRVGGWTKFFSRYRYRYRFMGGGVGNLLQLYGAVSMTNEKFRETISEEFFHLQVAGG